MGKSINWCHRVAQAHAMMKICIIGMKTMKAKRFSSYMMIKINYDNNKLKPKSKHKI
jgi:hypothetical protein